MSAPSICRILTNNPHTFLAPFTFRRTSNQLSYVWSRGCPRYLNCVTASTRSPPSLTYKLNSIFPDLPDISTSLRRKHIYVSLPHMSVLLCLYIRAAGMCIPQWSYRGIGVGPSCRIAIFAFQCRYIECSLILPGLCDLSGNPSTWHATDFNTHGKDTTYFSGPPPPPSAPRVRGMTITWALSMWWQSDNAVIVVLHSSQLTLVFFHYLKLAPSPYSLCFYVATSCSPHTNHGVHTIALVLPRLVCSPTLSNILTTAISVVCTQIGLRPDMRPPSAWNTILWSLATNTEDWLM